MQLPIIKAPSEKRVKGGIPRVNLNHPLAWWLVGAWLPGSCFGYDLTGRGLNLVSLSGFRIKTTIEGMAMDAGNASSSLSATAPTYIRSLAVGITLYTRCQWGAANGGVSASIGISYDNAVTSPFNVYQMNQGGGLGTSVFASWNAGGTNSSGTQTVLTFGALYGLAATFTVGGNVIIYANGVAQTTDAWTSGGGSGPPNTTATSTLVLNGFPGLPARFTDDDQTLSMVFSKALSATEVAFLDADPYGMFLWPEDDIFAELVGLPPVPPSVVLADVAGYVENVW